MTITIYRMLYSCQRWLLVAQTPTANISCIFLTIISLSMNYVATHYTEMKEECDKRTTTFACHWKRLWYGQTILAFFSGYKSIYTKKRIVTLKERGIHFTVFYGSAFSIITLQFKVEMSSSISTIWGSSKVNLCDHEKPNYITELCQLICYWCTSVGDTN